MRIFLKIGLAWITLAVGGQAQDLNETAIKQLVYDAILENPDIVVEAMQLVRERQRLEMIAEAGTIENAPVIGDPDAPITIVEFFDYNCGWCKNAAGVMRQAVADNPDVKIVLREYPILRQSSLVAARAALAARKQDKYEDFHWALMDLRNVTEDTILETAENLGIDTDQLLLDMESERVENHLLDTRTITEGLDISATPAFIVGDRVLPGYISAEQLVALLDAERAK
ncbi:MAG: DsbA family protein [Pseudomonadota bacterium]